MRSLNEVFTLCCCDWYHVHDPSLERSPRPCPDRELASPPLKCPLADGVAGVGSLGLNWGVSFGDTVGMVCGMVRGVTLGVRETMGGIARKSMTSPRFNNSSCRYNGLVKLVSHLFPWEDDTMLMLSSSSSSR